MSKIIAMFIKWVRRSARAVFDMRAGHNPHAAGQEQKAATTEWHSPPYKDMVLFSLVVPNLDGCCFYNASLVRENGLITEREPVFFLSSLLLLKFYLYFNRTPSVYIRSPSLSETSSII